MYVFQYTATTAKQTGIRNTGHMHCSYRTKCSTKVNPAYLKDSTSPLFANSKPTLSNLKFGSSLSFTAS